MLRYAGAILAATLLISSPAFAWQGEHDTDHGHGPGNDRPTSSFGGPNARDDSLNCCGGVEFGQGKTTKSGRKTRGRGSNYNFGSPQWDSGGYQGGGVGAGNHRGG